MFRLSDLFAYKRSYKVITEQKKFETYEFVITRNKLRYGFRKVSK